MEQVIKLSVIVPVYNLENYLARCLDSICNQTYHNLEIIVIDDGSTDHSWEIIMSYMEKDQRIIGIKQKNAGLIAVRERGILQATGDFVGFIDGDDDIEHDMYERLIQNAKEYSADISHCGLVYYLPDGSQVRWHGTGELKIYDHLNGLKELLMCQKIEPSLCNKIYKREILIDSCLDQSIVNNEDMLRNFVLFSRAKKSVFEDFCGYHYWRRDNSMSSNKNIIKMSEHIFRARELIVKNAPVEIEKEAYQALMDAYLCAYNSTCCQSDEALKRFNRECREKIIACKSKFMLLSKRFQMLARWISFAPKSYKAVYRLKKILQHKIQ